MRWRSSSSTCASASSYSAFASGLTGPSCSRLRVSRSIRVWRSWTCSSASACEAGGGGGGGGVGGEPQQAREPLELVAGLGRLVAQPLRTHLGPHQGVTVLAQLALGLRLAGGAAAQALRIALARTAVGGQLRLERLDPVCHRPGDRIQRGGETLGDRDEGAVGGGAVAQHRDL